jgi:hypothetical protein
MRNIILITALVAIGMIIYILNSDQPIAFNMKPDLTMPKHVSQALDQFLGRIEARAAPKAPIIHGNSEINLQNKVVDHRNN